MEKKTQEVLALLRIFIALFSAGAFSIIGWVVTRVPSGIQFALAIAGLGITTLTTVLLLMGYYNKQEFMITIGIISLASLLIIAVAAVLFAWRS